MDLDQLITSQLRNSPQEIQDYLKNSPWSAIVEDVAEQHTMTEEQTRALKNELLLVLLGIDLMQNFVSNIQAALNLNRDSAIAISNEIDLLIFARVKDFLPTEVEGAALPGRFIQTPTTLKPSENTAPYNLPTGNVSEEKILGAVGSPGEKLAWEQRKQIAAGALPKTEEKKYDGIDPYREPLG